MSSITLGQLLKLEGQAKEEMRPFVIVSFFMQNLLFSPLRH